MLKPVSRLQTFFVLLLAFMFSGCSAAAEFLATPTGLEPTLQAISAMLTETRAAPTATVTATLSPTPVPSETPTPTSTVVTGMEALPGKIGDLVESNGVGMAVLEVILAEQVEEQKAAEGQAFLDLQVMIENRGNVEVPYNPGYFQLINPEGKVNDPVPLSASPRLLRGILRPEEQVRGHLTFAVSNLETSGQRLTGFQLRYSPPETHALWVDLGQQGAVVPATGVQTEQEFSADLPEIGQRVEESGMALTVARASLEPLVGANKPTSGSTFLLLEVIIENVSRTRTPFNAQYFKVRTKSGFEYPAVVVPLDNMINAGSLGQGERVQGQVAFEIPEAAQTLMVTYQPVVFVEAYEEIRVVLSNFP